MQKKEVILPSESAKFISKDEIKRLNRIYAEGHKFTTQLGATCLNKEIAIREINAKFELAYSEIVKKINIVELSKKDCLTELQEKYGNNDYNFATGEIIPKNISDNI